MIDLEKHALEKNKDKTIKNKKLNKKIECYENEIGESPN